MIVGSGGASLHSLAQCKCLILLNCVFRSYSRIGEHAASAEAVGVTTSEFAVWLLVSHGVQYCIYPCLNADQTKQNVLSSM